MAGVGSQVECRATDDGGSRPASRGQPLLPSRDCHRLAVTARPWSHRSSALLVSHDGARWLPRSSTGSRAQRDPGRPAWSRSTPAARTTAPTSSTRRSARVVARRRRPRRSPPPSASASSDCGSAPTSRVGLAPARRLQPRPERARGAARRRRRRPRRRRARPQAARVALAAPAARARRDDLRHRPPRDRAGAR